MSAGLKRAFVAVVPPDDVLDAIEGLLERPKSSRFAWTHRDQWHITLQYYGRIADVDGLKDGVRAAAAAWDPIRIWMQGGGAFPNPKNARVFWLGVGGSDALIDLHATVAAATRTFIERRDRIPLMPHLTLARLKRVTDLVADVDALADAPVGVPWTVAELLLLESEPRSGGAVYIEQGRFPLGG
ncbi:MAG: RNA 2',3'-cyclic phosphodiesterase [Acidimicrobiia bacterium]